MPQDASFDELRAKDVPTGTQLKANSVIDPLVHYAGRTNVTFSEAGGPPSSKTSAPTSIAPQQTVTSTTKQLKLDYGKGTLTINAPAAQGLSGNLKEAGPTETKDLTISSDLELGHIIAVSLDGKPLATSKKILLQVMSEERAERLPNPGSRQRHEAHPRHRPRSLAGERSVGNGEVQARRCGESEGDRPGFQWLSAEGNWNSD